MNDSPLTFAYNAPDKTLMISILPELVRTLHSISGPMANLLKEELTSAHPKIPCVLSINAETFWFTLDDNNPLQKFVFDNCSKAQCDLMRDKFLVKEFTALPAYNAAIR